MLSLRYKNMFIYTCVNIIVTLVSNYKEGIIYKACIKSDIIGK